MSVNELLKILTDLVENGYGDCKVQNAEGDDIFSIIENENTQSITIYF